MIFFMDKDVDNDDKLLSEIENCVQQINRTRNIKGILNLKVNIMTALNDDWYT